MIVTAYIDGIEYYYHHNVIINNDTQFSEYYNMIWDTFPNKYNENLPVEFIPEFKVRVWNLDE